MSSTVTTPMTAEEFLTLPDDGRDRELIRGDLRDKPMTVRNRFHSECLVSTVYVLREWTLRQQRQFRVVGGEAGFILQHDPDSIVGIDVAVVAAEIMSRQIDESSLIVGAPVLAVEILSPSDTLDSIQEKQKLYLTTGVAVVWIIDPYDCTVKVCERGKPPVLYNIEQTVPGEPHLPGLSIPVRDLFAFQT